MSTTEKLFVDTNVFAYVYDAGYPQRSELAKEWLQRLWREQTGRTSVQVLNELYVILTRKLKRKMSADDAWEIVQALLAWSPQPVDRELLLRGREIEQRYRLSWWDSLIVAAAQLQDCDVLLTEDLQAGARFGRVLVRNPFETAVREPAGNYVATERLPSRHRPRGRPRKRSQRTEPSTNP